MPQQQQHTISDELRTQLINFLDHEAFMGNDDAGTLQQKLVDETREGFDGR